MNGNPTTMDLEERRVAERSITKDRRKARKEFLEQSEVSAAADLEYRRTKAVRYTELRASGETGEGSKIKAEADAADAKFRRDVAHSRAKAALLKIEEAERESVIVRDIHATSQKIDGLTP